MKKKIMAKSQRLKLLKNNKCDSTRISEIPICKSSKMEKKTKKTKISKLKKLSEDKNLQSVVEANTALTTQVVDKPANFVCAPKELVSKKQIRNGVKALFQFVKKTTNTETVLFDDEVPVFLQITSVKVSKTPARIVRLTLPHALLTESSEICLIVKDIGKPKEHEETIEHYEQLLNKHGITNIKSIMPYHQFKTEYGNQFELKRNLLGLYDYFLVDSRVSSYVTKLLGNVFKMKRKVPTSVKMHVPELKVNIERSLKKTSLKLHSTGDSFIVQVGHNKMDHTKISENISEIIDQLCYEFPGGEDNIRALSIKTDKSLAIPIYLTLKNKNIVSVPVIRSKRPKHFKTVSGELSTLLNKEVTVLPSGKVLVQTVEGSDDDEEDDMEEAEIE